MSWSQTQRTGAEVENPLDRSPDHHRANDHSHLRSVPTPDLHVACWWKPEHLKKTHRDTGRPCKQRWARIQTKNLQWGHSSVQSNPTDADFSLWVFLMSSSWTDEVIQNNKTLLIPHRGKLTFHFSANCSSKSISAALTPETHLLCCQVVGSNTVGDDK